MHKLTPKSRFPRRLTLSAVLWVAWLPGSVPWTRNSAAAEPPPSSQPTAASQNGDPAAELPADLAEILEIRRRTGGSVVRGTLLENVGQESEEKHFEAALQRVAEQSPPARVTPPRPHQPPGPPAARPATVGDANLREQLWDTGERLEARAASLDRQGDFERADRWRRLARQVRRAARELDPAPPSAAIPR